MNQGVPPFNDFPLFQGNIIQYFMPHGQIMPFDHWGINCAIGQNKLAQIAQLTCAQRGLAFTEQNIHERRSAVSRTGNIDDFWFSAAILRHCVAPS